MSDECLVEWTYDRPEGDIIVYARNKGEAKSKIEAHGFQVTNEKKLNQTSTPVSVQLRRGENI